MTITKNKTGDKLVLALEGQLDTSTAPQLQAELIPEFDNIHYIELDFEKLQYVSSAGLRVLLVGEKKAKANGGKMILVNISPEIKEVFEMTGFSGILTIE
ncbi:STAS domain-containing protein [Treponema primitia]|uniref:STAS domain-containing protein n=1 Tax=Treponema primitia TaxID=88058 RepID=UPI00397F6E62